MAFKKKKVIHDEFTYQDLPHNRWEVFKTLFKIRFGFIFKVALITILFCLPLLAWNTYGRLLIRGFLSTLNETNHSTVYGQVYGFLFIRMLANLPLFYLAFIGLGGLIRVYRKLSWSEITFLSDYFDNIKTNLLRYLFPFFVLWLSYHIMIFAIYSINALNMQPLLVGIMLAFSILQFAFSFIFCFFYLLQNDVYKIKFTSLIANSFKFVFKSLLVSLIFVLALFLPRILLIFGNLYIDLISSFLMVLIMPFCMIGFILFGSYQLDKWINKRLCPQIYDKGIYR